MSWKAGTLVLKRLEPLSGPLLSETTHVEFYNRDLPRSNALQAKEWS